MPEMSLAQAHDLAIQFQREGRLQESESICHQILQHHPNHPEVLNTLAILAQQQGNLPEAIDLYQRAIALRPELPELHFNLGNVHKDLGDFQKAVDGYRHATPSGQTSNPPSTTSPTPSRRPAKGRIKGGRIKGDGAN